MRRIASTLAWIAPVPMIAISIVASLAASCKGGEARAPKAEELHAGVLFTAKGVALANDHCVKVVEKRRSAANAMTDQPKRLELLRAAQVLNDTCKRATLDARDVLEGAEAMIAGGEQLADGKAGCAIRKGIASSSSICTALAREKEPCPRFIDDAIRFGSPLTAVAVSCSE